MKRIKQKKINEFQKLKAESLSAEQAGCNLKANFGFSLIELIIVVAIMMVVTSAVLFRQSKFSSDILITNMAYEVALSVRDAAVSGLSSRASSTISTRAGYGVHFAPDPGGRSRVTKFINFVDVSDVESSAVDVPSTSIFDYYYSEADGDIVDKTVELTQGQSIREYCAKSSNGQIDCGPVGDMELNIVYARPDPDAHITTGVGTSMNTNQYSEAKILVESGLGDKCRTVSISASGLVSVDAIKPGSLSGGCEPLEDNW